MKALSLWQPWGSLVAHGFKKIETRCWTTKYRGPLAIAATKYKPSFLGKSSLGDEFRLHYDRTGLPDYGRLPHGAVLCIVNLFAIDETSDIRDVISDQERAFGNYEDGRYAWQLEMVECFAKPIPAKGNRLLWNWEP